MSRLVLITRDIEQAKDFGIDIQSIGATPLIQPLLDIHYTNIDLQRIKRPSAIVLTSPHAVKGREFPPLWHDIPVFCVGVKTEMVARLAGAHVCITGHGTIDELIPLIKQKIPAGHDILYLCGEHVSRNLQQALPSYHIEPVVTYHARAAHELSQDTIDSFYRLHTMTLFSPRTGLILKKFMEKHDFNHFAGTINLLCLSVPVLDSVKDMGWKSCHVADTPTQHSMVDKLNMIFKSGT